MKLPYSFLRLFLLCIIISSRASSQEVKLSTVVATVNNSQITIGHVIAVKKQLPDQYQKLGYDVLFKGILDQLVQQEILASSFKYDPTWISILLENERRNILSSIILEKISKAAVTKGALKTAYLEKYKGEGGNVEYKASHILVTTIQEAEDLLKLLEDGADFKNLAINYSIGPSSPDGGDLGWFIKGQMVAPFEKALTLMEINTYYGPVKTQFGYHLIRLDDLRETLPPDFELVKNELEVELRNTAIEKHLKKLTSNADIVISKNLINPNALSTLDLRVE